VDGNKRIAFAATFVFLAINGLDITSNDNDSQTFILGLYEAGAVNFENLWCWLSCNTK
tara:strand:+ start:135 stop:308 length:174 start_codon:yes stop_codon:yes gene_type:complete